MCLGIPAKIISIQDNMARVSVGGTEYDADISMLDELKTGDYVLVHTGFALEKIDEEEARKTLEVYKEFNDFNEYLDEEEKNTGKRIV